VGNHLGLGYGLRNRALAQAGQGRLEQAHQEVGRARAIALECDANRLILACALADARIHLWRGLPASALADLDPHLHREEDLPRHVAATFLGFRAAALVALGRHDEAHAVGSRAMAVRDAIAGIPEGEMEVLLAAHDAGIEGALARALALLQRELAAVTDPELMRCMRERVPAHVRTLALARAAGLIPK
jgi:ATP/maltotriose-dependent transcriptional regulator MalT